MPLRHGMTVGELARMYNARFGIGATLHVVPVEGWRRDMTFDATGLRVHPAVAEPSAARGGDAVSGHSAARGHEPLRGARHRVPVRADRARRGCEPDDVIREMNALALPGVRFEAVTHSGRGGRAPIPGQTIPGVRLVVTDRGAYRAVRTAMLLIDTIHRLLP